MIKNNVILALNADQIQGRIERSDSISVHGICRGHFIKHLVKTGILKHEPKSQEFFTKQERFDDFFRTLINSRALYEMGYRFIRGEIYV